jgi:hypothetical protein
MSDRERRIALVRAADGAERAAGRPRRWIRDANGVEWDVREIDCRQTPGALGPSCLIFDSEQVVRRVWSFPADWTALPDADLLQLGAAPTTSSPQRAARSDAPPRDSNDRR